MILSAIKVFLKITKEASGDIKSMVVFYLLLGRDQAALISWTLFFFTHTVAGNKQGTAAA